MTTNSRDLVNTILTKGSSPERMGLYEAFWPETLQGWTEQGYPTEMQVVDGEARTVPVNPAFHFEYDMVNCGGLFDLDPGSGELIIVRDRRCRRRRQRGHANHDH